MIKNIEETVVICIAYSINSLQLQEETVEDIIGNLGMIIGMAGLGKTQIIFKDGGQDGILSVMFY